MAKSEKSACGEKEQRGGLRAGPDDLLTPTRPPIPKSKKERPASKGRVHKGRTRN